MSPRGPVSPRGPATPRSPCGPGGPTASPLESSTPGATPTVVDVAMDVPPLASDFPSTAAHAVSATASRARAARRDTKTFLTLAPHD
ncbi:MAG: hypothetical protein EBX87_01550 [Actinobacteria bacterium]|nr:hypothetical protein [Actinomycetota bacterium]